MAPKNDPKPAPAPAPPPEPFDPVVWATRMIPSYGNSRIRAGQRFPLAKPEDFDPSCMSRTGDPDAKLVPLQHGKKTPVAARPAPNTLRGMAEDNPLGA